VKAVDQNSAGFVCLKRKILRISDAKIKEGVFFNTGKWKKKCGNH
jgi:hypothetical protein